MKILVTGANGFVGKNLVESLKNIKNGNDKTREIEVTEIFEYDRQSKQEDLDYFCKHADFVFNLAGVNRPDNDEEFFKGNFGFASTLLNTLKKYNNKAPIMLSSSIQATLEGRYKNSVYGKSKLAGETLFFDYSKENGVKVLVYRFANLFGKWSRPNYNSVVATFCHNIANDLPIKINDRNTELELIYIDDLVEEMFNALEGRESRCDYNGLIPSEAISGKYCYVQKSYKVNLGQIADYLYEFSKVNDTFIIPEIPNDSFIKKLYSTYLSYLPMEKSVIEYKPNIDDRGSFTEILKFKNNGQFSINISKPGIVKGQHWHHTKWELFIVVKGKALIEMRKIGSDEVRKFEVSGDNPKAVYMLPGYTHNIINLSSTDELITLMWANELFDKEKPDTFRENV